MCCTSESIGRFRGASWSGLLLMAVMAAVLLAGLTLPAPHAYAASYPCTETGLNNAIAAGGSASFSCTVPTTVGITTAKTVGNNLTLNGGGLLTISGGNGVQAFNVQNLTILNGNASGGFGSGIFVSVGATVTVTNSTFSGNSASNSGGAIFNNGTLSVTNSTFSGNTASNVGGGILNNGTIVSVTNSTLSGNTAGIGGGIVNSGTLSVTNSTLSGNTSSGTGGSIYTTAGIVSVTNSTLSGNTAASTGGGINTTGGTLNLTNSLVVNNGAGGDLAGIAPTINSHNITGPLALPFGSPAIDTGICNPTYTDAVTNAAVIVTADGRGVARAQGGGCDIGAFENQGVAFANLGGSGQAATVTTAFAQTMHANAVALDPGVPTGNISVGFTAPAGGASGTFTGNTTSATVTTDATGVATSPTFTANTAAGSYTVIANIPAGGGVPARFDLTNTAGAAASITAISGSGGSAQIGSAFTAPLTVQVRDSHGNPAPNAVVTFTPPTGTNIPTVTLSSPTATTDASGYASVVATAAVRPGNLTVTASVPGGSSPASFGLSNTPSPTTLTLTTFSPPTGPITGGTVVTLHGTNLNSVTAVSFGGTPGTLGASTGTSLTVTAPAHAAGTVDISATTGTQTATIHGYTYLDVGSIAPQPQPGGHLPAGNVVVVGGGIVPMAQPGRR